MIHLLRGRYAVRLAETRAEVDRALDLRASAFRGSSCDRDGHDARCLHVLIEDRVQDSLAATFRLLPLPGGATVERAYSARFYDLRALKSFECPMVEIGRFCLAPGLDDPDLLRVALGAIAAYVDGAGVGLMFGCASFPGTDPESHADTLAFLRAGHLAPDDRAPQIRASDIYPFACRLSAHHVDRRAGLKGMPPLLRSYIAMGGWVSDHAVIDRDLGTMHVFTGVEVRRIPEKRAKTLRGVAKSCL